MCTVGATRCQYWGFSVRGVSVWGVSIQGGLSGGFSVQRETPPVNRMTYTSKNITLPKLRFQAVIMLGQPSCHSKIISVKDVLRSNKNS